MRVALFRFDSQEISHIANEAEVYTNVTFQNNLFPHAFLPHREPVVILQKCRILRKTKKPKDPNQIKVERAGFAVKIIDSRSACNNGDVHALLFLHEHRFPQESFCSILCVIVICVN